VETGGTERPAYLIFLTDGLPTEGEVDSQKILDNLAGAAPGQLRLFAFGVGYDVDTFLLDSLAQNHHGSSVYVNPGERLDEVLSGFYARISTPVLTDLELDFGDIPVYDLYPSPLPDLFVGSQILIAGRYRDGGDTTVALSGIVDGRRQTYNYPDQVFESRSIFSNFQSPISRLWATRKIGYLLNQVRLTGPDPEIVDQIVRLSIRFGIVTPYTSYLVTEPLPLGVEEQERIASEQYSQLQAEAAAPASGKAAVQKAADQGALSAAEAPAASAVETAERIRTVGSRTFILSDGIWIDTGFDPQAAQTKKVAFLSEDYFALAEARPDLAAAFALGQKVIAQSGGDFYEVVEPDAVGDPVQIQPPITSQADSIFAPTPAPESTSVVVKVEPAAGGDGSRAGSLPCLGPIGLLPLGAILVFYNKSRSKFSNL
jgi:Ca-activated chloride channel family protein